MGSKPIVIGWPRLLITSRSSQVEDTTTNPKLPRARSMKIRVAW